MPALRDRQSFTFLLQKSWELQKHNPQQILHTDFTAAASLQHDLQAARQSSDSYS